MAATEYVNPIYPDYFADPFVWEHDGIFYAVGTGVLEATAHAAEAASGLTAAGTPGVFTLLESRDFVTWRPRGTALERLDPNYGDAYWAPEVAYADGLFWMYYSVGRGDKGHHIRVATASEPWGPFRDTGSLVTDPFRIPFAIDAAPFRDDDGTWYLFYACDFLDASDGVRAGTGVVVDRLVDMRTLAGDPRVVVRPKYDWQRFLADRIMYGAKHDWHTIEGPAVCKREGRYWCLFSAGRWENESYGVDWAVADHILGPWTFEGSADGARLLRTIPGRVLGPGHNCIARGPNHQTDYIVYHAWDPAMTARRLAIDPLGWTADGPRCDGPSFAPRPLR